MALKVIGHIAPDTDTVCSPIAYAWFLKEKKGIDAEAYVSGTLNKETQYILDHFQVEIPLLLTKFNQGDQVFIMDTNNPDELLPGISNATIKGIIDHHKLVGGLKTEEPLTIVMEPIACTATIVWNLMKREGVTDLPKEIAGVMLCAILSDTLKFTSPTTTDVDRLAAEELAALCGEDIDSLSEEMFAAKSDLSGMSTRDILTVDSKIFEFGSKKARISVLETTKPDNALAMLEDLRFEMTQMKNEEHSDYVFFFVVDILHTEAHLVVATDEEKEIAEVAFGKVFDQETLTLPGVVSRKKQISPMLQKVIVG